MWGLYSLYEALEGGEDIAAKLQQLFREGALSPEFHKQVTDEQILQTSLSMLRVQRVVSVNW